MERTWQAPRGNRCTGSGTISAMKTTPINSRYFTTNALLVAAALLATTGRAQTSTHADTHVDDRAAINRTGDETVRPGAVGGELTHADRRFLEKAATSSREEVEISRIAAERSTNDDVKKFAQMMVDDHTRANEEIASFAEKHGVKLPDKNANEEKWRRRDAKDFDRDYVKQMVSDHKDDVELFRKAAKDSTDPEILEFARKTLPKLEQHYERANDLKKMVR
jgi:putative membrane protein